ncbi:LCP family protein [Ornithinimicrobium cerasi]|uniref:LCP family protein n=1 Tax=Ornithinimicrobium cerasi TaxID=2248773 RepID=UPI00137A0A53|nr:LCP family protein [Ornithinimicrobium cerasi]
MNDHDPPAGGSHAARREHETWEAGRSPGAPGTGLGRSLGLTTLSALLPGSGLLRTRAWVLGIFLVTLAVASLGVLAATVWREGLTSTALATAADERRLRIVLGILIAGTVLWVGAVALTAVLTRPRRASRGQRWALAGFTALLCLAVTTPAALGTQYITSHLSAMDKVFTQDEPLTPGSPRPTSALGPDRLDPWAQLPRVNMLLLGSDAAEAREGTRTDTMIVASIDTHTGESVLFSIPRNLQRVPIPRDNPLHEVYPSGRYDCGDQCLMNAIWTEAELNAEENPQLYADDPTPGLTATRDVLSAVLGVDIHHTVIVNLEGFSDLVDAMGGVRVTVQEPIPINGRTYTDANGVIQLDPESPNLEWLEPGTQTLTGRQALGYSRSRVTTDDFSRMRRQRCMVAALIEQADPMTLLQRYPQIISAVGDNVVTDIPQSDLGVWAELVLLVQGASIQSLPFTPQNTDVADPDFAQIRYDVWEALHPAPEPAPAPGGDPQEPTATATPAAPQEPDDSPTVTPDDGSATTTESDELSDIGAVCD